MMPDGYEPELVSAQVKSFAGIFGCNDFAVFSVANVELGSGIRTIKIHQRSSDRGTWTSWLNTENFLLAWNQIIDERRFLCYDWTVKVDPDVVFFPGRLRAHLQKLASGGGAAPLYIKNCPMDLGFVGA